MLTSNAELEKSDLIRPLSYEALEYFAGNQIPLSSRDNNALKCRFVRLGEAIMIGATIHFGPPDASLTGDRKTILRADLLDELLHNKKGEVATTLLSSEPLREHLKLHDAGFAIISATVNVPVALEITDDRVAFERADAASRQRTVEIAQQLVGANVMVIKLT